MIEMGYGYFMAYEPTGQSLITVLYSAFYTFASVVIAYVVANKFGYTQYLPFIALGPALLFYSTSMLPFTAILLVLFLFGLGELYPSGGYLINPTLIDNGGAGGGAS
jgi:hypothetical protein